jgi:hypothetical protein
VIYILLVIIAVGALLASEAGAELLGWLIKLLLIVVVLYVAFWIVVIAIGLLSSKETRDDIFAVFGTIALIFIIYSYIYSFYQKYRKGDFKKEVIKNNVKGVWLNNWNAGTGSRIAIVFVIVSFSVMAFLFVWSLIPVSFW